MPEPLPTLQLVALDRCVLHENVDPQRVERLAARISAEDMLRNPPIVARSAGTNQLMVLDGATRTTALRERGFAGAPVQIVNYADHAIELHTWAHVLHAVNAHSLLRALRVIPRLHIHAVDARTTEPRTDKGGVALLLSADGDAWLLEGGGTLHAEAQVLDAVFRCYMQRATVQRLPHDQHFTPASLPAGTLAMIFPRYTKLDLLGLTRAGGILPAGITRHIIPGRVLRLNVPLARLREGTVEQQSAWFAAWVAERIAAGRARLYAEPTWLFDE